MTFSKKDVCVLIPAYNEGENVVRVIETVKRFGYPVLVVDDGSKDRTPELIKAVGCEAIFCEANRGKGAVLREGFERLLKSSVKAIVVMDADGQHDPREIDFFIRELERGDTHMVVGNRMARPEKMPFIRQVTNRFMSDILSAIVRQRVPDTQCGYRALTREALGRMRLKTSHFEIESEMILEAGRNGFKISSVPIRSVYAGEKSSIHPIRDTIRFFSFLFVYLFSKKEPSA